MRQAWAGSFAAYPTYPMYVEDLYEQQETVIVLGHTSSSHVSPEVESLPHCVLWEARMRDGLMAAWIISPATPEKGAFISLEFSFPF